MSTAALPHDEQLRARFGELKPALTAQAAVIEADRCLNCFDAPCTAACPTHIDVPGFIKRIASGNLRGSALRILDANILGASCARVCPVDVLCEGACVLTRQNRKPIQIGQLQRHAMDAFWASGETVHVAAPGTHNLRVACIGGGPASLACAAELCRQGARATVIERRELPAWSAARLEQALAEFPREYQQVPPMHSAIKQDGRPLYAYARAGEWRERAPRLIMIREMRLIDWRAPDLSFDVRCTKGAYIRVLAEDLAARLETIGHLTVLKRLAVAPFGAERQWSFESLETMPPSERTLVLLPVDAALVDWRRLDLPADGVQALRQGQPLSIPVERPGNVRIYAAGVGFLGLGAVGPLGKLVPLRLISAPTNRA